jgi:PleD family two-component response regulator
MLHHRAFGRDLDKLVIAVIDTSRPMLSLMRAMLAAIGAGRIDTYEAPALALQGMARSVPDIVIAAALMKPMTGPALVKAMRRSNSGPLALVPAMIMSARANAALVEEALRAGAHQVLVLPTSASTLYRRLAWLIGDDRPFELKDEHYVVAGMEERLSLSLPRPVYVPPMPDRPFPTAAPDEEPAAALDIAKKMRAAPH